MSYTIQCRNCGRTVAKTPNQVCVNCRMPKWGYTDAELNTIAPGNMATPPPTPTPPRPAITKLVCKHCNTMVAKTPNNRCIKCSTINWGYTDYELANGMIKTAPDPVKKKMPGKFSTKQIAIAAAAVVVMVLGILFFPRPPKPGPGPNDGGAVQNIVTPSPISPDSLAMAVARVETPIAIGTAFLISPTKLLTAAHVVINFQEGKIYDEVTVIFTKSGNRRYTAKVLRTGAVWNQRGRSFFLQDFALLEIQPVNDITPLKLGNSDEVKELAPVMTIGHSQGDQSLSFTEGTINSTRYGDDSGAGTLDLFKHSITSNHGNSGGPIILKSNSTVIGILVGGRSASFANNQLDIPQGENIANKISNIRRELNDFNLSQ